MKIRWAYIFRRIFIAAAVSVALNLPILFFRMGKPAVSVCVATIGAPFVVVFVLEVCRHCGYFRTFLASRSFEGLVLRTFICTLSVAATNLLATLIPSLYLGGFDIGFVFGLLTEVPFATIDHPTVRNPGYWKWFGFIFGALAGVATGVARRSLVAGLGVTVGYIAGLWFGLWLGYTTKVWVAALRPMFGLLRKVANSLIAFGAGYFAIILSFATFFAAIWKLQGEAAFTGLPANPDLKAFVYFSLSTATTVGYGDITPHSQMARGMTGAELITALGWTLIVFAAVSLHLSKAFADEGAANRLVVSPNKEPQAGQATVGMSTVEE